MLKQQQTQVFILHLGAQQSIGPTDLRTMWATACSSLDIAVSRRVSGVRTQGRPCYTLWAGRDFHRAAAEQRLRALLEARGYRFTLTCTAL